VPNTAALRDALAALAADARAGSGLAAWLGLRPVVGALPIAVVLPDSTASVSYVGEAPGGSGGLYVAALPEQDADTRRRVADALLAHRPANGRRVLVVLLPATPHDRAHTAELAFARPAAEPVPGPTIARACLHLAGQGPTQDQVRLLTALALPAGALPAETANRWEDAFDGDRAVRRLLCGLRGLRNRIARAAGGVYPPDQAQAVTRLTVALLALGFLQAGGLLDGDPDYLARLYERHRRAGRPDTESEYSPPATGDEPLGLHAPAGGATRRLTPLPISATWEGCAQRPVEDFYHSLLVPLLDALATPPARRPRALARLLGEVPYLGLHLMEPEGTPHSAWRALHVPDSIFDPEPAAGKETVLGLLRSFCLTAAESTPDDRTLDPDPSALGLALEHLRDPGERRRTGAFTTPCWLVRFMCRRALDAWLRDTAGIEQAVLDCLRRPGAGICLPEGAAERLGRALDAVRIGDPAVGAGALLVGAMQEIALLREGLYAATDSARPDGRQRAAWRRRIAGRNLYGLDVDPDAVTICRLRLWLVQATNDPARASGLRGSRHVSVGDALAGAISIAAGGALPLTSDDRRAGDSAAWPALCPEVFAGRRPGFDIVLANPPYVRQERLDTAGKERYARAFPEVYDGGADLLVFFHARALQILRPGGRLAVVSSNKYLRAAYGARLRHFLSARLDAGRVLDFGDLPVFGAAAYPAVLTGRRRPVPGPPSPLRIDDLTARVRQALGSAGRPITSATVGRALEILEDCIRRQDHDTADRPPVRGRADGQERVLARLIERLMDEGTPLETVARGRLYRGVLTGLNAAFVIDEATRDRLAADGRGAGIIRPWLRGRDIGRWRAEPSGLYVIFARQGVDIDRYPAVRDHLGRWRTALEPKAARGQPGPGRKPGPYRWYEIQDSVAYHQEFARPKVLLPHFLRRPAFAYDTAGRLHNNAASFCIAPPRITALLNSTAGWLLLAAMGTRLQNGYTQLFVQFYRRFPVPPAMARDSAEAARLDGLVLSLAAGRAADEPAIEAEIEEGVAIAYGLSPAEREALDAWAGPANRHR
jgi:hypothetical protein